jgi:hypothetical protein
LEIVIYLLRTRQWFIAVSTRRVRNDLGMRPEEVIKQVAGLTLEVVRTPCCWDCCAEVVTAAASKWFMKQGRRDETLKPE